MYRGFPGSNHSLHESRNSTAVEWSILDNEGQSNPWPDASQGPDPQFGTNRPSGSLNPTAYWGTLQNLQRYPSRSKIRSLIFSQSSGYFDRSNGIARPVFGRPNGGEMIMVSAVIGAFQKSND